MVQVRICWGDEISQLRGDVSTSSKWASATPELLGYFEAMVNAGNSIFGNGTHWIEHRHTPLDAPSPDEEVRQLIEVSMAAWGDGDMQRHVEFFTESAIHVSPIGTCARGRAALLKAFNAERTMMPGLQMNVASQDIIHTTADSAVVLMKGDLYHSGMPEPQAWASTQTVVRADGAWKIATLQVYHPDRGG